MCSINSVWTRMPRRGCGWTNSSCNKNFGAINITSLISFHCPTKLENNPLLGGRLQKGYNLITCQFGKSNNSNLKVWPLAEENLHSRNAFDIKKEFICTELEILHMFGELLGPVNLCVPLFVQRSSQASTYRCQLIPFEFLWKSREWSSGNRCKHPMERYYMTVVLQSCS